MLIVNLKLNAKMMVFEHAVNELSYHYKHSTIKTLFRLFDLGYKDQPLFLVLPTTEVSGVQSSQPPSYPGVHKTGFLTQKDIEIN